MSTHTRGFAASDIRQALAAVRAELGEDAVIVSHETAADGSCVVYAVCEQLADDDLQQAGAFPTVDERYRSLFLERVRRSAPASARDGAVLPSSELRNILLTERAPEALASRLADAAERTRLADGVLALASAIDGEMKFAPVDLARASALLLCGPHGAGKTTTAARLAAQALALGRGVRLVATDTAGAGALARLQAFADGIGAEIATAETGVQLADLVAEARQTNTLVIADSRGFDPRSPAAWRDFLEFAKAGAEVVAVVSAACDAEEASEMVLALKELGAARLIVTCTDLVRRRGTLLTLCTGGLPLAHVSESPFVGEGVRGMTPVALARDIVAHAVAGRAAKVAA